MDCIIGAGLSGLLTAYKLGSQYRLFEREHEVGGKCKTFEIDGFFFDSFPILPVIPEVKAHNNNSHDALSIIVNNFIINNTTNNYLIKRMKADVFFENSPIKLPLKNQYALYEKLNSVYVKKFWKREILEIKSQSFPSFRYSFFADLPKTSFSFAYPKIGGLGSFANSFIPYLSNLELGTEVIEISPKNGNLKLRLKRGKREFTCDFKNVFSSIPLIDLPKIIDLPSDIVNSIKKLEYLSTIQVNIGIARKDISHNHSIFFPEKRYIFNRLYFPMNLSKNNVPKGCSSLTAEISFADGKKPDLEYIEHKTIEGLKNLDIIRRNDRIEVIHTHLNQHAFLIPSQNNIKEFQKITSYLGSINIFH